MVFYKIEKDLKGCSSLGDYNGDVVMIISDEELKEMVKNGEIDENVVPNYKNAKCCKASVRRDCISGVMSVISKDKKMDRSNFGFIFSRHKIIFVNSEEKITSWIAKMQKDKLHGTFDVPRFMYDFLETIIDKDLRYIEEMSDRATKMESAVTRGILDDFSKRMGVFRKELMGFYRYYTQLVDVGEELQENENSFFDEEDIRLFEKFTVRAGRLREEIQILMDVSGEVRDAYRVQLDAKQNKNMNFLTIITAICMPVTITSAWYGMNFANMPELEIDNGYLYFIILNIVLILGAILLLKKKKIM